MISVNNLTKSFGSLQVLRDITTEIKKGEIIAIIGPSGTGKSTFLRCLNLLETPSGGEIFINGIPLLDRHTDVPALRRKMGMVFQSFNLYNHLTVKENLTIGPIQLLGRSPAEAGEKALEWLKLVGLAEKAESFPDELSGGQKQRVAIARCMAMEPEILLFDEPTSALDPTMVSEVLSVIRRLSREGMTMLIVTHEMEFARNTATRVFYMDEGIIYEEGSPQEIFDHPRKEKTRAFINRIRSLNLRITSPEYDLYALQGEMETFCEKHFIGRKMTGYVLHLAEEVLLLQRDFSDVRMVMSYSEKDGNLILTIASPGEPYNFLDGDEEQIGLKIILARCKKTDYRYEEGKNTVVLHIAASA